jgi:hypothetical protein
MLKFVGFGNVFCHSSRNANAFGVVIRQGV